jgi:enoyl-CoA hydratase/carnithine racemase
MGDSEVAETAAPIPSREELLIQSREGALWITLNRPEAMNAISPELVSGINAALDRAQADDAIKAVVLTGTGKAFCAGGDLKFLQSKVGHDQGALGAFLDSVRAMLCRLENFPRPVIALVNGVALAGGLELVLCCDLVIAARSATLGDAHANLGLLPGGGASVRLPRKIGVTRAKYLLFTGESQSAEEFVTSGLVNQVVDDDRLMDAARSLVQKLETKSTLALRRVKSLVDDGLEQPREIALRAELLAGELHAQSFDMTEGLKAFVETRRLSSQTWRPCFAQ